MEISSLLALCAKLDHALSGGGAAAYGVPAGVAAALANAAAQLGESADATEAKRTAYLAQKEVRDGDRKSCAAAVSAVTRAIYAMDNSPAMIVAAGLQPHSTTRTKVVPVTPTKLFATPLPSGEILAEWDRSGNAPSVNFILESRLPGGEWGYCGDTTSLRFRVTGYAPGQSVELRVSASKNKITSVPSATATVFPAQSSAALRLAA